MNKILLVTGLALSSAGALAQAPAYAPATTKVGPSGNASEIVCVVQTEIGSRLNLRRVCRIRAEWAEHRLQYRLNIEHAQTLGNGSGR